MWDWLDPRGRCSNRAYVRVAVVCSMIAAPLVAVLAIDGVPMLVRAIALVHLWLLTAVMWLVAIRRAHDEDYSAWQAYAWMGGPTLLLFVWITLPTTGFVPSPWLRGAAFVVGHFLCCVGLYAVAQAQEGARPNRFGPPTIQRPSRADQARYHRLAKGRPPTSARA